MWAPGSEPLPTPSGGLTLLELLVVLAVLGVAIAAVSLAFREPGSAEVEEEAQRLAALLEAARAQSRQAGLPVRWQVAESGFRFEGGDTAHLPRTWKHEGITAQVQDGEVLLLGPEPVIAPQQVLVFSLRRPQLRWRVGTYGVRPFAAERADGASP